MDSKIDITNNTNVNSRYQSESNLENNLIKYLVNEKKFNRVNIRGMKELENNLKENLNSINNDVLNGKTLSDSEFERILVHLKGKSIYQSARQLRDKYLLERDDQTKVYIQFIDLIEFDRNNFEVANQITVEGRYKNRYDVTILCNGFPIIQIELKRRGMAIKKAFNQVCRYARHTYSGLFRYIQLFVISNGVNSKYFANSDQHYRYEMVFYWTDKDNKRKSNINDFSEWFFEKKNIIEMLDEYMVINDTDKLLMVLRPYQVWATKALIKQATETANNGYVWHGTGSGKTLTSFKSAQILANRKDIKKVIFVVDRQDIDAQSVEEFNKFEKNAVDSTDNTKALTKQLKDDETTLVVTTIQKLYRAIRYKRYEKIMSKLQNEKIIFIVDECHRTQFGDMNTEIRKYFNKAQYFGFTGTPRFKENASQDKRTTADIFGRCIHNYLLKDAISDKTVLGFSVEYIKTIHGKYDENDLTKVRGIKKDEIWDEDERILLVANHIIQNYDAKTVHNKYNALFSTRLVKILLKYYDVLKEIDHDLRVGAIFSYQDNMEIKEDQEHYQDALNRIMQDYNKMYGTSYDISSYGAYKKDITRRIKKREIDLVLVVDQLLTGFDSKVTNTLFVDRNLEYHDLIQAFSRPNRIFEPQKQWGNIVCYRNIKTNTDEAIKLFNNSEDTDIVLQKDYEYYLDAFKGKLGELYRIALTPNDVDELKSDEDKKQFIVIFKSLSQLLLALKTFVEFEFDAGIVGIDQQMYEDFKSKYLDIYEENKNTKTENENVSILDDIDFDIELIQTDRINFDYIMNLIRNINFEDKKAKAKDIKNIHKELDRTDNPVLKKKIDLIKDFLNNELPAISDGGDVDSKYTDFESKKRKEEIVKFAEINDLNVEFVEDIISDYEFNSTIDQSKLAEKIKMSYLKTRKVINNITSFVIENVEKYQ